MMIKGKSLDRRTEHKDRLTDLIFRFPRRSRHGWESFLLWLCCFALFSCFVLNLCSFFFCWSVDASGSWLLLPVSRASLRAANEMGKQMHVCIHPCIRPSVHPSNHSFLSFHFIQSIIQSIIQSVIRLFIPFIDFI